MLLNFHFYLAFNFNHCLDTKFLNLTEKKTIRNTYTYLASVGLYVTSYFSSGVSRSTDVCQDTFTDVGLRNVTVIFSGAVDIEPEKRLLLHENMLETKDYLK